MSSAVAAQIKELVVGGQLSPGDQLPSERVLSERLRVGRPTVREAIQQLVGLGLLEVRAGRGVFVRSLTPESVAVPLERLLRDELQALVQVIDVRIALEGWVAAEAARRATPEQVARLHELVQAMEDPGAQGDVYDLDLEFHRVVLQASHNTVVLHMVDTLTSLIASVRRVKGLLRFPRKRQAPRFHREIASAIAAGNATRAQRAMVAHLRAVRQTLIDAALTSSDHGSEHR
jgi:DNA-binding FadR family transcriptional regulator